MDDVEAPDGRLLLLDEALTSEAGRRCNDASANWVWKAVMQQRPTACSEVELCAAQHAGSSKVQLASPTLVLSCPIWLLQTWRGGRCLAQAASRPAAWRSLFVTKDCPWLGPK